MGPMIIIGVGSVDFAVPVNGVAEAFSLFSEVVDVGFGGGLRRYACFYGIVFGWKSEGVVAERTKNVALLLSIKTG